jgi:hypothetical protein
MAKYKESGNMRYWLLVIFMNVLFYSIVSLAAPEWKDTPGYFAGQISCTLIPLVITWRDPPGWIDEVLLSILKYGVLIAGIVFFAWGVGCKLEFWGQHNPDVVFIGALEQIMPNLALATGVLMAAWGFLKYIRR